MIMSKYAYLPEFDSVEDCDFYDDDRRCFLSIAEAVKEHYFKNEEEAKKFLNDDFFKETLKFKKECIRKRKIKKLLKRLCELGGKK